MHVPPRARSLSAALLSSVAGLGLLAGATTAEASGSQEVSAYVPMTCTADNQPAHDIALQLTATVPATTAPGEPVSLTDLRATMRVEDPTSEAEFDYSLPNLSGYVSRIDISASGAAPAALGFEAWSTFNVRHVPYAGFESILIDVPALPTATTTGTGEVVLRVGGLSYGARRTSGSGPEVPLPPAPIDCTPIASTPPLGVIPNAASTVGTQAIDATVQMQCTKGPNSPHDDVVFTVRGSAPASVGPGGTVRVADVNASMRTIDRAPLTDPRFLWGNVRRISLALDGTTQGSVAGQMYSPFGDIPHTDGGYGPFLVTLPSLPSATATGGPVVIRMGRLEYGSDTVASVGAVRPPYIPDGITCTPKAGQPPMATVAAIAPVADLPVVNRVYGSAWGNVGGIFRVHGAKLNGARYVAFGAKRVRPLLVLGSKDLWVLAPPLPKGRYSVTVATAAGVSAPSTGATAIYR